MTAATAPASAVGELPLPPELPGGWSLVAHMPAFVKDTIGLLYRAHREVGPVAGFKVGHIRMALLTGPEASEAFYRAKDEQLSPSEPYKMMVPVFGKVVAAEVERALASWG